MLDPNCEIRTTVNQVEDLVGEIQKTLSQNNRILITTLTKRNAEDLTNYLKEKNFKADPEGSTQNLFFVPSHMSNPIALRSTSNH